MTRTHERIQEAGHEGEVAQREPRLPMDSALVILTCAALLYAVSWAMGCSSASSQDRKSGGKKLAAAHALPQLSADDADDKLVPTISGRKLTVEKMAQRAATSTQFSDEEYGVSLDAPKGYLLKEGDLPEMDRGLGYLGPIPMHFVQPGGVRLVTAEPPRGLHLGTNFVNEFLTVSAHYGAGEAACAEFDIPAESRGPAQTRTVDGMEFRGYAEHFAASMHQYDGVYLHAFANETCYEIGYGVATVGASDSTPGNGSAKLKTIDRGSALARLEKLLPDVHLNPPAFERESAAN